MAHHVYRFEFRPLIAFSLPVLAALFGFTSLLYMRGKSLARGKEAVRTLLAAERTMQGTVAYLSGIVVGGSLYGILGYLDYTFDPAHPGLSGLWLLLFLAPYALMQAGFTLVIGAVWTILPQFLRPVSRAELERRIGGFGNPGDEVVGDPPRRAACCAHQEAAPPSSSTLHNVPHPRGDNG